MVPSDESLRICVSVEWFVQTLICCVFTLCQICCCTEPKNDLIPQSGHDFIDKYISIPLLFKSFPSLARKVDLARLLEILPKMKPRFYSISSAGHNSGKTLELTVGVLVEKTEFGAVRYGLCSNYLHEVSPGENVMMGLHQSQFRLPTEPTAPVICVGPGPGLAPFCAFLDQRREEAAGDSAPMSIYTSAQKNGDLIYTDEIDPWSGLWRSEKTNAVVHTSLSREGEKKRVNQLMLDDAEAIVNILIDQRGYYYCCGSSTMAESVNATMVQIIAKVKHISKIQASLLIAEMRDSGRYQMDVWGIVSLFNKNQSHMSDKKAQKTKNWFNDMKEQIHGSQ
jgi:sulfite reductase alpha subunit-like flavoprotein